LAKKEEENSICSFFYFLGVCVWGGLSPHEDLYNKAAPTDTEYEPKPFRRSRTQLNSINFHLIFPHTNKFSFNLLRGVGWLTFLSLFRFSHFPPAHPHFLRRLIGRHFLALDFLLSLPSSIPRTTFRR